MNQMREQLAERETKLTADQVKLGYDYALAVGDMIKKGDKMSFNRAFAHQGQELANELGITDAGAKRLMKDEFKAVENAELYDWGKELEEQFYRPQIEAEKQSREANGQSNGRTNSRTNSRGRGEGSEEGSRARGNRGSEGNDDAPARRQARSTPVKSVCEIDPPAAMGRPARGGPRSPSGLDEKPDGVQPDAPASPSLAGNEPASGHVSGQDQNSEPEKYLVHIAHLDLALPVKIELISALRDIVQSFVDRAFGDDPVQHCQQIEDQAGNGMAGSENAGSVKTQETNGPGGRRVKTALAATDLTAKNLPEPIYAEDSLNAI